MSRRDPIVPVRHMLAYAREAVEMVRGRNRSDLDTDRMLNLPPLIEQLEAIIRQAG